MAIRPSKKRFPNPFYVLLLLTSTAFVLTTLGYLVSPTIQRQAANQVDGRRVSPTSVAAAAWLDRNAPKALGVEFAVMLAAGLLAMATDRWFPAKTAKSESSRA
jgi:hypothetical protein